MATSDLRIVSLLPAATEIAWELGLGGNLVGRSHECDWPAEVRALPTLTRSRLDPKGSCREIHEAIGQAFTDSPGESPSLFILELDLLAELKPDLVLTQATCGVCAVAHHEVDAAMARSRHPSRVVTVNATTLAGLWADILTVGRAAGTLASARELVARLKARCDSVAFRVAALGRRRPDTPRVAVLDWLDPPMAAGHWVPELVRLAGGIDVCGCEGKHSHWIDWSTVAAADPDVLLLAPCGLTLERTLHEAATGPVRQAIEPLRAARTGRTWAIDGHHLLNRPGPRIIDSLEVLASVLQPGIFAFPIAQRFAQRVRAGDADMRDH